MEETQQPSIIQALPAAPKKGLSRSLQTRSKQDTLGVHTPAEQITGIQKTPPSSRCTRSQAAPDWTVEEMLVLVSEIAALNEDWLKALSSYQKWKMISDNCAASDVFRSSNQCKRKWESLLADYWKIRNWESRSGSGSGSYWQLEDERRKQYSRAASIDREVFSSMGAILEAHDARLVSGDSDPEDLTVMPQADLPEIKMLDVDVESGSEEDAWSKKTDKAREMASKLQKNAEQIHAILRGELTDNVSQGRALVDLTKPNAMETEFSRRQADELIKAFGMLVGTLDQFTELIKNGECKGIRP